MPVIHMTPYLHPDKFAKMQDTLGAYKVILTQPAPAVGISNFQGGHMEIVTVYMRNDEAKLRSWHCLLISMSM